MNYRCIIEPGKNHKHIEIIGEFISNRSFISQMELSPKDIVICTNNDWFLITSVKIEGKTSFEHIGTIVKPNEYLEIK
jgi:hypothetical protein